LELRWRQTLSGPATRKSAMALAQTEEIARRLAAAAPGLDLEIVKFETTGVVCSSKHRVPDLPTGRAVGLELLQKGAADIIERSRPV
jgi:hypothetical protein